MTEITEAVEEATEETPEPERRVFRLGRPESGLIEDESIPNEKVRLELHAISDEGAVSGDKSVKGAEWAVAVSWQAGALTVDVSGTLPDEFDCKAVFTL